MPVEIKRASGSGQAIPDTSSVPQISTGEARQALEPTIRAFAALASLHSILAAAERCEAELEELAKAKKNLAQEVKVLQDERDGLALSQDEELQSLQNAHMNKLAAMEAEMQEAMEAIAELREIRDGLAAEIGAQREAARKEIEAEGDRLMAEARDAAQKIKDQADAEAKRLEEVRTKLARIHKSLPELAE